MITLGTLSGFVCAPQPSIIVTLNKNLCSIPSQILKRNESVTSKTADPPSSAILVVYLDKAEALPVSQMSLCVPPCSCSALSGFLCVVTREAEQYAIC